MQTSQLSLSGIIWLQGERDANAILDGQLLGAEYKSALINLIERFRMEFGKKLPFYIVQTGYQTDRPHDGGRGSEGAGKGGKEV